MIIVKTHKNTLPKVIECCKHALEAEPTLSPGEIILIAQTIDTLEPGLLPIRYRMEFARSYVDKENESDCIWGKHWKFIIEGRNCRALKRPFDIHSIQTSNKNYRQGGPFVHVDPIDEEMLVLERYLDII